MMCGRSVSWVTAQGREVKNVGMRKVTSKCPGHGKSQHNEPVRLRSSRTAGVGVLCCSCRREHNDKD